MNGSLVFPNIASDMLHLYHGYITSARFCTILTSMLHFTDKRNAVLAFLNRCTLSFPPPLILFSMNSTWYATGRPPK